MQPGGDELHLDGGSCAGTSGASCTVSPTASTTYSVQGVNAGGANQAASVTVTVTANTASYTVPGTLDDDVLVPSGGNNYFGGGGNDVYIISPYTLSGAVTAKIIDSEGSNVVQLVKGLTIASSSFFTNAVQLTLSNGAKVQVLGCLALSEKPTIPCSKQDACQALGLRGQVV